MSPLVMPKGYDPHECDAPAPRTCRDGVTDELPKGATWDCPECHVVWVLAPDSYYGRLTWRPAGPFARRRHAKALGARR